ncbi:MAG: exopolysaccharide biosynthesis protein [Candidatus Saccharimonadales bacterium]
MTQQPTTRSKFSDQLETWLKSKQPKTLASLEEVFQDKSFAISFLLLMILPALPLPTGGITHVFEIITMLLALELIIGLETPWLPKRWKHMKLGKAMRGKVIPLLLRRVRWFERRSSPRWQQIFRLPLAARLISLVVFGLTLTAFLAPPFSGLDTLPSLGVVLISLALILDDALFLLGGLIVGLAGCALVIGLSEVIFKGAHHLL